MASLKKRGSIFYIQFYLGGQQRRVSTDTDNWQIAKEKLRQFESDQHRGDLNPLPTKTPIADVATVYVAHIRTTKAAKSAQTDIFYLRDAFGPICEALQVTSRKLSAKATKRPPKEGQGRRRRAKVSRRSASSTSPPPTSPRSLPARCKVAAWHRRWPTATARSLEAKSPEQTKPLRRTWISGRLMLVQFVCSGHADPARGRRRARCRACPATSATPGALTTIPPMRTSSRLGPFTATLLAAAATLLLAVQLPLAFGETTDKLTVTTSGNVGFTRGSDVFAVGMAADDFVKRFGKPEGTFGDELCYYSKGVEVAVDVATKKVKQMTFFYAPVDYSDVGGGSFKPANVTTDKGIAHGASREEIIKRHGKPSEESPELGDTSTIEYPWGRFYFKGGALAMVEVQRTEK